MTASRRPSVTVGAIVGRAQVGHASGCLAHATVWPQSTYGGRVILFLPEPAVCYSTSDGASIAAEILRAVGS